jgi:peptide/nickel transport system substrate-binding protein
MEGYMRKGSILLVASALALVASLIVGPAATATVERQAAGTVVFGADQEPNTLAYDLDSMLWMSMITNKVHAAGEIYNNKAQLVPYLMDGKPKVTKTKPFTTTFKYKANAVWNDGKPITGRDFVTKWRTIMNPANNVVTREGFDQMTRVTAKGKSVTVVWKGTYAPWENYVASSPLPTHYVAGKDYNKLWANSLEPASGPFRFVSWTKGQQIVLQKNPQWKAGAAAKLDRIVFRFIPNTATQFQALRSGEVQITNPQFQLQLREFLNDPKIKLDAQPGYFYEHLDFQFGPKGHAALKQPWVRQAIMAGINRAQISRAIYGAVLPKPLPVLNSVHFMPFEAAYRQNFTIKFSQANVIKTLKAHRCTGGPDKPAAGNRDIFSCPGVGKLSFRFVTTTPNQRRSLTFEIIQAQLRSVGIELVPRFGPAPVVFGTVLPSRDWDMIMFTWLSTPLASITAGDLYGCGGGQNDLQWCNRRYTKLMDQVKFTPDPAKRNALVHQAEKIMAKDVPTIPLYSSPDFVLSYKNIRNVLGNPTQEAVTWNAEQWALGG